MREAVFRPFTADEDKASAAARSLRVLLIEDVVDEAHSLRRAFRANGLPAEIHEVPDGHAALQHLYGALPPGNAVSRPDLILLNLTVPAQEGLDLLARVKGDRQLCAIPIVVIGASLLEADVRAAYRLGAAGYVRKPGALEELHAVVRILGDYWFKSVRLPHNER